MCLNDLVFYFLCILLFLLFLYFTRKEFLFPIVKDVLYPIVKSICGLIDRTKNLECGKFKLQTEMEPKQDKQNE